MPSQQHLTCLREPESEGYSGEARLSRVNDKGPEGCRRLRIVRTAQPSVREFRPSHYLTQLSRANAAAANGGSPKYSLQGNSIKSEIMKQDDLRRASSASPDPKGAEINNLAKAADAGARRVPSLWSAKAFRTAVLVLATAGIAVWGQPASSQSGGPATQYEPLAPSAISRRVQFDGITFVCGTIGDGTELRRFIHSDPATKYLPESEPAESDPLRRSWLIVYRIICERDATAKSESFVSR